MEVFAAVCAAVNSNYKPKLKRRENNDIKQISSNPQTQTTMHTISINGELYKYRHSACRRGYCRVSEIGTTEDYNGKFGTGIIVRNGRYNGSTRYESISYYINA